VTFRYALDGDAFEAAENMAVTNGVHSVYVLATDVFDNAASFGGYLARVDKQAPAAPAVQERTSGSNIILSFTFRADPGGSGNDYMILPDGTRTDAGDGPQYSVSRNGTYTFTLYDTAGNRTVFTYTVSGVDISAPTITYDAGPYRVGEITQDAISVRLTFADGESSITARGYQLAISASPGSAYRSYSGVITVGAPGTYYIHAYARNAFGLTVYVTFGPFILEEPPVEEPAQDVTPSPEPEFGDVVVRTDDLDDEQGETVYIRLPGEEWSQTLTLENAAPGEYLIEAMDKDGNVRVVKVRVTARDIFARSLRSADSGTMTLLFAGGGAAALLLILLLLFVGNNVTVRVLGITTAKKKSSRMSRRIHFRKKTLTVRLDEGLVHGGRLATIRMAKHLTKRMRGRWVVVEVRGVQVLREMIPPTAKDAFRREIRLDG
jgi:hypothetical protein